MVTTLAASISGGFSWQTVAGHMAIMGPWLAAHWEEYHSGVMLYGNGYWGVTEANYLMVAVHLFTAAVGPGARSEPRLVAACAHKNPGMGCCVKIRGMHHASECFTG